MVIDIEGFSEIENRLKKYYPSLTEFEIVSLAIQLQRNQILENGFVITRDKSSQSGLEALVTIMRDK